MRNLARTAAGAALGLVLTVGALGAAPGSAAPAATTVVPASAGIATAVVTPAAVLPPAATTIRRGPSRILLTPGPSTTTTQRISWTMRKKTGGMRLKYKVAGSSTVRSVKATRRAATAAKYSGTSAPRYTVVLRKLKPGTRHSYRIVTKHGSTKWRSFTTARPKAGVTFIGLGDTQIANRGVPRATIKQALARAPKAAAILHAGDVVNNPTSDSQWADLFSALGDAGRTRSVLVSIGNHEHCVLITCKSRSAQAFRSYFPWPTNGFPRQGPTWFYTDYPGARVIVLDSFRGPAAGQAAFLDRALATNRQPFSIVLMHAPAFASNPKRTTPPQVAALLPVLERRNADLVLTGHDHSYARGYRKANGTAFVTSVSGPKYYPVTDTDWRKRGATRVVWAQGTSTYQVISIKGRSLSYKAYVSHRGASSTSPFGPGGVLDSFVIDKSRPGDKIVR